MDVMLRARDVAVAEPAKESGQWSRLDVAVCGAGVAGSIVVGLDGSPAWQVARVAAVIAVTALALAAARRSPPRRRGRVSAVIGGATIAIAAGLSPHVAKGGSLLVAGSAIVLAVAALVLLVDGILLATSGRHPIRRWATFSVAIVATAVSVWVVAPSIAATNVPRPRIGATPAAVGLAFEEVSLRADDGIVLAAWYVPSRNGAAVVVLHGAGSTRSDVLEHAAVLARAGFGVLMLDARGHGESGGRAMDFGWEGDVDIAAATGYLAARADVDADRIGLLGMSMGGEEAIGASASNDVVRAVVAEGATTRSAADDAWLSEAYGVRGVVQEGIEWAQDRVTSVLTTAPVPTSLRSAVRRSAGTVYLLIAAGSRADEAHAAAYIAGGAPDRVEIWNVIGAGHTRGLDTAEREWTSRVVSFFEAALRRAPPRA